MPVDYSQTYTSRFVVKRLDNRSWLPIGTIGNVASLSLDMDGTDSVPLLETGDIEVDLSPGEELESGWYQIVMLADQRNSGYDTEELATLWIEATKGSETSDRNTVSATGRSALYPASTNPMPFGEYVPKGVEGASYCAELLGKCCPAPVEVEGSFTVDDYYVFKEGTKILEAVWTVLKAGGFCIQLEGNGTIWIRPLPTDPAMHLGRGRNAQLLSAGYEYTKDMTKIPNVYIARDGEQTATAVNDDPTSRISTVGRGFKVVTVDTSPIRVNGETLQSYADRRLEEERSSIEYIRTYTREYDPNVKPFSIVRWYESGEYPQDMRVKTSTLTIGYGVQVKETAVSYVRE